MVFEPVLSEPVSSKAPAGLARDGLHLALLLRGARRPGRLLSLILLLVLLLLLLLVVVVLVLCLLLLNYNLHIVLITYQ